MRAPRLILAAAAVTAVLLTATACGLDAGGTAHGGKVEKLTVYTSRPQAISSAVIEGFEAAHPQYQVTLLTLGAQEVAERVKAEASRPQADVWWGGTSQQFDLGVRNQLLEAFPQHVVDRIPAQYRGADALWLGEQRLAQVIAYNHDMMTADEAPADWDDLIKPEYQGKILIRDVAASGTMRAVFSSLIYRDFKDSGSPEQGYEFLRKLDANTKDYAANPQDLFLRIQRQEAPVTVWNLQDILTQEKAGVPFTPVIPASGAPILLDGVGKVKGAPHPRAAADFAEFLLSVETQQKLADENFQISTVELPRRPSWPAELDVKEMNVDWRTIAGRDEQWIGYWVEHIKGRG